MALQARRHELRRQARNEKRNGLKQLVGAVTEALNDVDGKQRYPRYIAQHNGYNRHDRRRLAAQARSNRPEGVHRKRRLRR